MTSHPVPGPAGQPPGTTTHLPRTSGAAEPTTATTTAATAETTTLTTQPGGTRGTATDAAVPRNTVHTTGPGKHFAIQAEELAKTYRGGVRALSGLSFGVAPATVFGLLGPNGAGKSTTVKILTTLSRPDSGTASVAGIDVLAHPEQVRHRIGVVAQRSGIDLEATGRENIALAARLHGLPRAMLIDRVTELLDQFELTAAADRPARTYSGGMLRKLDVAVGLVHRPSVLFLDEPTTGLDPQARAQMWDEIGSLAAGGLTILLTTHYLEEADRLASLVAIIDGGRILVQGSPDALKSELKGDAVHLELAAVPTPTVVDTVTAALDQVPGVTETTVNGREVHARVTHGASSLPAVFAALDRVGVAVIAATIARPSLDDVYLRHVGRRFTADAGSGADTGPVPGIAQDSGAQGDKTQDDRAQGGAAQPNAVPDKGVA
ncbi:MULTISPECIES: ATP-binding cassette domain-containing protein [Protofrankia]|uniref:Daunorubicin resistance ABC transporter ATPase subunit n=1 Tax=Candidatus Protofrankia datiscae TaxID=2716812 RepID=F8AVK0_9ACTN|nr:MULTISPECIES: ATP-binding cassette domain-containing protein [Protofrankia]AEH11314.1 daunorubicin resistance ABC transporter ATPase subunit [Candidatus Protofrankia datiscae]